MHFRHVTSLGILLATAQVASAANIPVVPKKLVVVDKIVAAGKAKVAFVVKDPAVTKGAGEDPEQISVQVDLAYGGGSAAGAFVVPAGTASGWVVNKATVAKYVNKSAPAGPTEAKVAVIKPAKLLKLVGKGLGDTPFDVLAAGDPAGPVLTAYCVDNAGEENCHCSSFTGCVWKSIGGGTGAKLVCKTGTGDAACSAIVPPTTTSTSSTTSTTTSSTTSTTVNPCFTDNGATVLDTCNGLEWEKKNGADGIPNAGNLNDVDNTYPWSGRCTGPNPDPQFNAACQPDPATEATCIAQTGGAGECSQCPGPDGPCLTSFGPTIFQWVNALNAATFAGATDWRIPLTTNPELSFILDLSQPGCNSGGTCIAPIFGPTVPQRYWGANSSGSGLFSGRAIDFGTGGNISGINKAFPLRVRAVRP